MYQWILTLALVIAPLAGFCEDFRLIHSEELVQLYEQDEEIIVLDARGKKYYNGYLLPKAQLASIRLTDEQLEALIPSKDSLVVVYCSNIECPVSNWMATRLLALGYTNVYEYPEGIDGWMELGYLVEEKQL